MLPDLIVVDPHGIKERLVYAVRHCPDPLSCYFFAICALAKETCLAQPSSKESVFEEHWFLSDGCVLKTQEVLCN